MDEFKSEDELRPDSSDRRPPRQRKGPSVPKVAMSRQHMMIGIGILVLLLVVIGVGSALKSPTQPNAGQQNPTTGEKNIDLSGSPATSGSAAAPVNGTVPAANPDANSPGSATGPANGLSAQSQANGMNGTASQSQANGVNGTASQPLANGVNSALSQPQTLSAPPVASTPTEAPPIAGAVPQHRIDLPGNMADALSQQGNQVNGMTEQMNNEGSASTLPTAPATVAPAGKEPAHPTHKTGAVKTSVPAHKAARQTAVAPRPMVAANGHAVAPAAMTEAGQHAPAAHRNTPAVVAGRNTPAAAPVSASALAPATPAHASTGAIQTAPAGFYTLQLSSASQAATLNAYAHKQQLSQYWVYETRREGKPWYVLVSGVYSSSSQAKSAVAQLPAGIQANKPWARQIGQVKQDQNK
ncbi:SPOR domain-containing protein [Sodalis sp. dw_96]|uniref:SPOR domain-containing protein n=1 Tax=Sodalis sp. dw_96 TaxID=2719794 RepID=UPI001BD3D5E8|nr:SPOR domain-containing protein [Sodalis sp. dw_96]